MSSVNAWMRRARDRIIAHPLLLRAAPAIDPICRRSGAFGGRLPPVLVGLPPNLDRGLAAEAAGSLGVERIDAACHVVLNGWKAAAWTTRVFVRGDDGAVVSMICKSADYREHVPALAGLPLQPGPPELEVLSRTLEDDGSRLRTMMPRALAVQRLSSHSFVFLLEDIGRTHRAIRSMDGLERSTHALVHLHRALDEQAPLVDGLDYAAAFASEQFLEYVGAHVADYADRTGSALGRRVAETAAELVAACTRPEWPEWATGIVHGDPNPTNVLQRTRPTGEVRFIDWEWAGRGLRHGDLACLTKSVDAGSEARLVNGFAARCPEGSPLEHHRLYLQAKLARGLLDASFFSAQSGSERRGVSFDIESPLRRVLTANTELATAAT
jgi:hypothetical protein